MSIPASLTDPPETSAGSPPAPTQRRAAAFFDLDKTLIARSSVLAYSSTFRTARLITRRTLLRSSYAQFRYLRHGADHDQMERMRAFLAALCTGWEAGTVRRLVSESLERVITPLVFTEARALMNEHRAAGRDVVIVSASGSEVVEPIGDLLGADAVLATEMVTGPDGRYTGEIGAYRYGPGKATAIRAYAADHGFGLADCFAYSDSITDLPMLEVVGHPAVVNPDDALRRVAVERGWPQLDFAPPPVPDDGSTGVEQRTGHRRGLRVTALGAAAAATLGGLAWALYRARTA